MSDHKAAVLKRWPEAVDFYFAGRWVIFSDDGDDPLALGAGPTEEAAWQNAAEGE